MISNVFQFFLPEFDLFRDGFEAGAADEAALIEIPKLPRNFNLIATLGRLAPMLGFFDTVICFLKMFKEMENKYVKEDGGPELVI